ncbi:MAG: glycosyltransferase family protein [Actinomycetota bacterium]|nr:glycosyltransferase family protein [Actinomycetota bacterium]
MVAIGSAITSPDKYERYAEPGIKFASEPDTQVLSFASSGTLFRSYNLILDQAAKIKDLEFLVLIHQDAEIIDPDFIQKIRDQMKDPDVALVGCAGSVGVRSIAWWEGAVTWASFEHHYEELGGGRIPALTWLATETPSYANLGEVDMIDGFVIGFTPWAIQNLRFDEITGGALHGYDFDISHQARDKGKKVVTADLKVIHHHSIELISDLDTWVNAHIAFAKKWEHMLPAPEGGSEDHAWEERARRAEAEASAARTMAGAGHLINESMERELNELKASKSWKVTKPMRDFSRIFKKRKAKKEEQASRLQ